MTGDLTQPPINDLILTIKSRGGRGKPREKTANEPGASFDALIAQELELSHTHTHTQTSNVTEACSSSSVNLSLL